MAFPYSQQTWTDGVSSASAARLTVIEAGVALAGVTGTSSTPPGSPVDGMIWRLPADSGNGIYWFFQYDSSQATYKWVFMGGPPMYAEVVTDETTASTTYAALATAGPSIAIPRSGDYEVQIGFEGWVASAGATVSMSYDIGGTGAVDAVRSFFDEASASGYAESNVRTRR
jgi:hypothetical protein